MNRTFTYPPPKEPKPVNNRKPRNNHDTYSDNDEQYIRLLQKIEDEYNILGELNTIVFNDIPIDGFSKRIVKSQSIITHFNSMLVQTTKYNHRTTIIDEYLDLWIKLSDNVQAKKALNFSIIYYVNKKRGHIYYENSVEALSMPALINGVFGPKDVSRDTLDLQICMLYLQLAAQKFTVADGNPRLGLIKFPTTKITYVYNNINISLNVSYVIVLLPTTQLKPIANSHEAYISYLKYMNVNSPGTVNICSSFMELIITKYSKLFLSDSNSKYSAQKPMPLKSKPYNSKPITGNTEVGKYVYIQSMNEILEGYIIRNDSNRNYVDVLVKHNTNQYFKTMIPRDQVYYHDEQYISYGLGIDVTERF